MILSSRAFRKHGLGRSICTNISIILQSRSFRVFRFDNDDHNHIQSYLKKQDKLRYSSDFVVQMLNDHKAPVEMYDNGISTSVSFYPSPHLYDRNGKYSVGLPDLLDDGFDNHDLEVICNRNIARLGCDSIEAAFFDTNNINIDKSDSSNANTIDPNDRYEHRGGHGFLNVCSYAWSSHYPLKLEPTQIWLLILQAVALHVDDNSELLRNKWVEFEGKKTLTVVRDNFVKGTCVTVYLV